MREFDEKKFEEPTLSREQIFHGQIFQVVKDLVSLPDDTMGTRELVFHNGGVAVAPIIDDKLILVGQYRKAFEKFIFEVPAGKLEDNELDNPKAAALRELEEETGYTAEQLVEISSFYGTPGFSSEKTYLYFPSGLTKLENPRPKDEGEFLEVVEVTLDEAKIMIEEGQICDAKTIMSVWYWELQNLKTQGDLDA
ncbi:NUDIX hydrolase [Lactococcus muris]|uniref:NUDIX hydrolase n=1 Tax=Lactococcus muris TaxID=2941330 RepID=A0ABV4D9W6_9LACT|nr:MULTISPECIES: NUDIX hydrolase [Lactococcus]MBL3716845.1 NUDIX domain-containing protein [Lactococcus garvieae]